jgi:acetyl esterase/lipase
MLRNSLALALVLSFSSLLPAQEKAKPKPKQPARPTPTVADYAYANDHERQRFDFWQAKSDKPTPVVLLIHGGGWMNGDKTSYGGTTIQAFRSRRSTTVSSCRRWNRRLSRL